MTRILTALFLVLSLTASRADGPADNQPDNVRRIPPPGIAVSPADRSVLETGLTELNKAIEDLRASHKTRPDLLDLLPDIQIYYNAVHYALQYDEFFNAREIPVARELLRQGLQRAAELHDGKAPWTTATGLVVRGYVSTIDGSVQPYGLVIPPSFANPGPARFRLDLWFHGRGETLSELNFINDRQHNPGEFRPPDTVVLHPYGRYCNSNKFAGEVDTFEALDHAMRHYPIDPNRIAERGFSMGGAAAWQFAVHYPSDWGAAAPGAGFSETADFLKVFQQEQVKPTWYEQKLWHLYDCTDYALNLFDVPTVAYSGELDSQKQAADMMAKAATKEGITLTHIIGPGAHHFYEAGAKTEVARRVDAIMARGRNPVPQHVRFVTYTLRYNRCAWLSLEGLRHHWERAEVDAAIVGDSAITVKTTNVTAVSFHFAPGECPLDITREPVVTIDGQRLVVSTPHSDRSWDAEYVRESGRWKYLLRGVTGAIGEALPVRRTRAGTFVAVTRGSSQPPVDPGLRKMPGLQGPIDDAFWDSFVMVRPSGSPLNEKVGAWAAKEMDHAIVHWRRQFRGEARVVADTAVTDAMIASSNLVLWGDPTSNKILARIADQLPVKWNTEGLTIGPHSYAADHHVPVMIFPNPLNPKRYVVLNSGFTFREYDYLNNARQVPKLPDWAVVDISKPVTSRLPGRIANAGFFGERWEYMEPPAPPKTNHD